MRDGDEMEREREREAGEWRGSGEWLMVGCIMSQQHASVSQGRICFDNLRAATLR